MSPIASTRAGLRDPGSGEQVMFGSSRHVHTTIGTPPRLPLEIGFRVRVPHDPDGNAWRRAIRATVVVPTLFGLAVLVGSDVVALYVLFGSFTMLVFGDFGGATRHRITAYVGTTVAGLALIVVGTALSQSYVAAAIVAFAIECYLTSTQRIGSQI